MLSLTNEMSSSSRHSNFVRIIRQTDQACTWYLVQLLLWHSMCNVHTIHVIQCISKNQLKLQSNTLCNLSNPSHCVSTYSVRRLHSVLLQSMYKTILYLRSGPHWTQIGWKWHNQISKASQIELCIKWTVMVALLEQHVVHWACHCCYTDSYTSWSAKGHTSPPICWSVKGHTSPAMWVLWTNATDENREVAFCNAC